MVTGPPLFKKEEMNRCKGILLGVIVLPQGSSCLRYLRCWRQTPLHRDTFKYFRCPFFRDTGRFSIEIPRHLPLLPRQMYIHLISLRHHAALNSNITELSVGPRMDWFWHWNFILRGAPTSLLPAPRGQPHRRSLPAKKTLRSHTKRTARASWTALVRWVRISSFCPEGSICLNPNCKQHRE